MDKAAMLRQILAVNSKDAFARYGLAMEYAARDELDISIGEFTTLLRDHPEYTPGYFMAAQTLVRAGRIPDAKQHLVLGIGTAERSGNTHAESEMRAMLDELELSD